MNVLNVKKTVKLNVPIENARKNAGRCVMLNHATKDAKK
jgi:hypothetical protein